MGGCFRKISVVLLAATACFAFCGGQAEADAKDASASIIHGSPTTISKWPWQVAIANNPYRWVGSPRQRTFCGGVVLAPRLVLTARHCLLRGDRPWSKNLVVYSGRTWLNDSWTGRMSRVRGVVRPSNRDWDVALVRLWQPVLGRPIRLASSSEYNTWRPGQVAYSTGWGVTRGGGDGPMSRRLRVSKQVILPNGVCRRSGDIGRFFRPRLMVCHGSPTAEAGTCHGDSGGPLVVPVRTEYGRRYRLAGLTSFGNEYCWKDIPSVASRVSGDRLRRWIIWNASSFTPVDIVGASATPKSHPDWCQVPYLDGLRIPEARAELRQIGCYGARFEYITWVVAPKNRVTGTTPNRGWLLYRWAPFEVSVAK